ncbi:MAG: TolC family protein [Saprospiraceae bacterium]
MFKYIFFILTGIISFHTITAQTTLTKAQAVQITLANNFDIQMAKNDIEIARNNTSRELNGYLPTVNATAGVNSRLGGSKQQFGNGNENTTSNAFNWGSNATVQANYTLVDKSRGLVVQQLEEVANLTDLQLRQTIENNVLAVFNNYYEVARLEQNSSVLEQTIELSKKRLQRAQYQYDYGQGIRLNVLNAEVDIQRDSINLMNLKNQIANAKRNLNVAMGRTVTTDFEVDTVVIYQPNLNLPQLIEAAKTNNILVKVLQQNLAIAALDFDIIEATKKPTLGANANYNFTFSDNAAGSFIDVSNTRGLSAGVTLSWNLYDGGRRKLQNQNAKINVATQLTQKEQVLQQLERDVINAWGSYQNALFILKAEAKNLSINQLNFERTEEQFKVGQVNSVEFRQAQLNLLNAATSLNTAKFDAKIIEIQLLQLSGQLMEGLE